MSLVLRRKYYATIILHRVDWDVTVVNTLVLLYVMVQATELKKIPERRGKTLNTQFSAK